MNSKEYKELIQVYQNVYEQQIGVPLDKPTDGAAARKLQQMIPKGEKVYIPKSGLQKAHYEPEGQQLQEKPGDGYLGPTPIPNPIRLAKDTVDATNRATQRRVDAVNKIQPGSASMPKVNYFNKGPSAASQKYLGLKNEQNQGPSTPVKIDPKMGVVPNQGAGRVGAVRLKPGTPASSLIKPVSEQDLFDIVKGYLISEGYVKTEKEALYMMSNMSEEIIQDIIEAAVQPSLITSKGKAQNFTKPNRVPFTSSTPVPTRSTTQATPPRRPPGGFGNRPAGQLKLDLNKPATKPAAAKPAAAPQRSQQFRDVQRLNRATGGGVTGTTKPTNLEPRAPKPAWKPTTKPTTTSAKPAAKPTTTSTKPNPYRPGATVRATGPNMDKFPQLQRFANQARKVAEPVSKVAGAVAALRNITPAGVAASVMAPRPTGDATLKGALKSGAYKPKQGPANPDQGLTKSQSFDRAFSSARKSGKSGFTWNNRTYTTKVKESFDDFDLIQDYLISEGYADNTKAASAIVENMSEDWLDIILEDLEERRRKLVQRQREQVAAAQKRVASHQQTKKERRRQQVTASRERAASNEEERRERHRRAQEKEQIKNELRKELRREAVGDPISPNSVFKLSDPVHQKNIRSAATPAGPAPMKPTAPKQKPQSSSDRFVKRMVGSTMLSPL